MKKSHIAAVLETIEADQLNMLDEEFRGLVRAVDKTGKHGIYTLTMIFSVGHRITSTAPQPGR